ncbi:hydroxycarboxylate dehydrogenase B-like isoform X5 [Leguminivora glycinivorella]|uniref:hydroxycarboxylate dehydrogenase B-like isoform X5 n=1 Tax=Leguminivora glycinivorella TaxID=1035111 RepID=UPI00200E33CB|nr:hydroxycarboxylate dehydrogenase B-like isoform X5 [Leguminivora glycinivorella]
MIVLILMRFAINRFVKLCVRSSIMPEVRIEEVSRFMRECFQATGVSENDAREHTALLLQADFTGHYSHGLNRVGSTHFGMAGYWAQRAEKQGLIGMAFTNSSPLLVPTRAKEGTLGTNPIAMAAPASGGDSILVDMSTTAVAMGKVEMKIHEGKPLPDGWAMDQNGKMTHDPNVGFKSGRLYPLGGLEETSGYKGYCLSAMNEVFCSTLSGAKASHQRPWGATDPEDPPNLGQMFVAIDPGCFAPGFGDRLADCLSHWRNLPPVDPSLPVLAPGDKERSHFEQTNKRGTIVYEAKQIESCASLAKQLGVKPILTL